MKTTYTPNAEPAARPEQSRALDEVDLASLIRAASGRLELLRRRVDLYEQAMATDLPRIRTAIAENELATVRQIAHRLKWVAAGVGADGLVGFFKRMEDPIFAPTPEALCADLSEIGRCGERVAARLRDYVANEADIDFLWQEELAP